MKCAICGDEIKGKGKKLADGNTVCKDCYESSALVVTCGDCGKEVLATSAVRVEGFLYCKDCLSKAIKEEHDWPSWKDWKEGCEEDGETADFGKWIARVKEDIEEYGDPKAWTKAALEVAAREIEAARKARRKAAA
jgi:DNA-directed RNA polymerase subunit RPC12/RpoP